MFVHLLILLFISIIKKFNKEMQYIMKHGLLEIYKDFVEHAMDIKGYGSWHSTCEKTFNDFNDWLAVGNDGTVTQFEMSFLEAMYVESRKNDAEFIAKYEAWRKSDEV